MNVTLYIAEHKITGLKYFGKTTKYFNEDELEKNYHGSGKAWKEHLKEYGDLVSMKIYWSGDESEVEEIARKFSIENDIVESSNWANLIIEIGIGGYPRGPSNKKHSEETKTKIGAKSKGRTHSEETKMVISDASRNRSEETLKKLSDLQKNRIKIYNPLLDIRKNVKDYDLIFYIESGWVLGWK